MKLISVCSVVAWLLMQSAPAGAVNPELQALFFAACENPTGPLAVRCGETGDAAGDLSGDSESSLNPSQVLSANGAALREALGRRDGADAGAAGERDDPLRVQLGRLGLTGNVSRVWETRDRTVDVDEERGYDLDADAAEIGLDYRFNDAVVGGLMLVYQRLELDYESEQPGVAFTPAARAGRVESDAAGAFAYVSLALGEHGYLDVSGGFSRGENDYERFSVFQESGRTVPQTASAVAGSADTRERWLALDAGWMLSRGAWTYAFVASLTDTESKTDAFEERDLTGSGLAMRFSNARQTSLVGALGLNVQRAIARDWGVLLPHARAAYHHDFDGDRLDLRTGYLLDAGGNTLALRSDRPDDGYVSLAVGLSAIFPRGWVPFVDVSYWAGYRDLDRVKVQAGLRREL